MIEFVLAYPISANRYWRTVVNGHRVMMVPTSEAKAYKTDCAWRARAAGLVKPWQGWIVLDMTLHPVEPQDVVTRLRKLGPAWHMWVRCLDIDNAVKVTVDALQGVAYENDGQVVDLRVRRGLPIPGGGLTVRLDVPRIENVLQSPQAALLEQEAA